MATYAEVFARSQDANVNAQIATAISVEAKYKLGGSIDPDELAWATYAVSNPRAEASNFQLVICLDPAIADAVTPSDENVQAAVGSAVPIMVNAYKSRTAPAA